MYIYIYIFAFSMKTLDNAIEDFLDKFSQTIKNLTATEFKEKVFNVYNITIMNNVLSEISIIKPG